ncbi:MAG: MBL fold metallo-hydrolase [Acidobacteria bacterium]|uniref:MBL fold metallo-hydrolase n=1 Tax=Candidatus Polarisedimenticola svalbardensis TaxID=2886004 RepID=A0A8J7CJR6_9BACT|nr:MBL fold metallo-hydrolase [Candidatus Polarisedimenticola svalbardensis]
MLRFEFDDVRLTVLPTGSLRLDGGAMFGVVPKPLWEREHKADDRNRILLAMNVLLVEDGDRKILIDTGAGEKWDAKERDIFALETSPAEDWLKPAGLTPPDIDMVVCSHLHFDHAGGNTVRKNGSDAVAAFPNAVYVMQQGELELARSGNERTRASYMAENYEPLLSDKQVRLVNGDTALTRCIRLRLAPGHTPHMQVPLVRAGGGTFAYLADLVPTASHVRAPYIMGYDLEPLATLATKKALLAEAARNDWRLVFEHDPVLPVGRLVEEKGRLKAAAVEPE